MIHFIYDGCNYCGTPIPVGDDYTEDDTVFCSQVCFVQRIVYDMIVAFRKVEVQEEKAQKKRYGFKLQTPANDGGAK